MKSSVETLSPTRVKLTVEVTAEELKPHVDETMKRLARQLNFPGFRPGKVPTRIVEQRLGRDAVVQEAAQQAVGDFYQQALIEKDLRPLSQAEVDYDLPATAADPFSFTAEVDIRPEITLPSYDSLSVEVDAVDDAAITAEADERMTTLRQRFGTLVGVERAAKDGDFVSIDLRATIGDEEIDSVKGVSYEIGSNTMLPGLDEALIGLSAGESKDFTAPLAGGEHAGEDAAVTVTVGSVKERELPELDDDFAQMASEFDTLAELQDQINGQARQAKIFEQGVQARDKVMDLLLEKVDVPLPEGLIQAEVYSHLEGEGRLEDETHRAEVEESTRSGLRQQLLLDAIAEELKVEVEQQDLIEYIVMSAQQYGMDPNQFAAALQSEDQRAGVIADVARRKALVSVLEQIKVVDAKGNAVDLSAPLEDEADGESGDEATAAAESEEKKPARKAPAKKATAKTSAAADDADEADADEAAAEKPAAKKAATRKPTASKAKVEAAEADADEAAAEKPAAKKTATRKPAASKAKAAKADDAADAAADAETK